MHLSEIWHNKKNDCRLSRTQVFRKKKILVYLLTRLLVNLKKIPYLCILIRELEFQSSSVREIEIWSLIYKIR